METTKDSTATAVEAGRLVLRPLAEGDVAAVIQLERASFEPGWAETAFERELKHNGMARYIVLATTGKPERIIGFAGAWLMVDEAHVVSMAVRSELRGRGYGRLLLHGLIELAREAGMDVATLECRVSNTVARNLYGTYGFYEVGLRKRYYADNKEDAVIMTTEELNSAAYVARLARLEEELAERLPGAPPRVRGE